jgi:hypothetical protein
MATYKVIQDIEAEDKLVGPLTLRQFIYAAIAAICLYLSFLSVTHHATFLLAIFLPIAGVFGFFAFPWGQDQPTEIWALAKIRFLIKPRRRIWDQSGVKELVTVTVPKTIERHLTNGLDQDEVVSRLQALAHTIDSRGWAIKNVNVNLADGAGAMQTGISDRLVTMNNFPQEVSSIDVRASDDILDPNANPIAQQFETMINASTTAHHQQLVAQMQQPIQPPVPTTAIPPGQTQTNNYWFTPASPAPVPQPVYTAPVAAPVVTSAIQQPIAAVPTPEEEALIAKFKQENASQNVAYGHLKVLKTPEQLAEEARQKAAEQASKPPVTPSSQAAIMDLASNDDLDVATIARQAHKATQSDDEVIISLH